MTHDIPHPACSSPWEMICFKDHLILCALSLLILKTIPIHFQLDFFGPGSLVEISIYPALDFCYELSMESWNQFTHVGTSSRDEGELLSQRAEA